MSANNNAIFVGTFQGKVTELTDTTETDIFVADATEGTRLDALCVSTDDTTDKDLIVRVYDGTASKTLTTIKIPLTSGMTNAIVPVNLLANAQMAAFVGTDSAGTRYINLPPTWKIRAAMAAAPTAGKKMWVFARGGKY